MSTTTEEHDQGAKEIRMTGDRITVSGRILEKLEEAAEAEGRELDDAFFSEALSIGLDGLSAR